MTIDKLQSACCIAGGGPAGMMLGFVLARAGVDIVVLEKHADFLRDFRGDTIHPPTLEVIHELGLLEDFLKRPHQEPDHLDAQIGDTTLTIVDFSHLPTVCKFIALMPQWDFLDFLSRHGHSYPSFKLRMEAEVTELIQEGGRVVGVVATTPGGTLEDIGSVLANRSNTPIALPLPLRLLRRWAWPRRIPALVVGLGFRPEHVMARPLPWHGENRILPGTSPPSA